MENKMLTVITFLKPCPFCGSANVSINIAQRGDMKKIFYVECSDCSGMCGDSIFEDKAVKRWNTRATQRYSEDKLVKPVVDITKESLFKIFAKVHGCKLNNEDCMFSRCHSWSGCEVLAEAILKEI
jgi:Lar family restriction alleviation protein